MHVGNGQFVKGEHWRQCHSWVHSNANVKREFLA